MEKIKILDHGYIGIVESWGSDERVIESARMSTDKGFLGWGPTITDNPCDECGGSGKVYTGFDDFQVECKICDGDGKQRKPGDEKLLRYLYEHWHHTPFEMAGVTIEVQAPIFVFREWHRHRTQSYNELSARYVPIPDVNYVPTIERLMINAGTTNKQAGTIKGAKQLTVEMAEEFQRQLRDTYERAEACYQAALAVGVPKEVARLHIPVGRYSRMRASANLRNWLAFITLRDAPDAQFEIREYAHEVSNQLTRIFPRTMEIYLGNRR